MGYNSFMELEVWKKGRVFKSHISKMVKSFPSEEKFRLTDQLIRASRSFNSCIAEGHGRFTYKDQTHFCIMARGSLSETINHLVYALDENYISTEVYQECIVMQNELERMINGYISYLKKAQQKPDSKNEQ